MGRLMKYRVYALICAAVFAALYVNAAADHIQRDNAFKRGRDAVSEKYRGFKPVIFSMWTPGVVRRINVSDKVIAITLDACGGKRGNLYDSELIDFLRSNNIPATLFLSGLWIDDNQSMAKELARDPLFEIENHGLRHRPASVNGAKIYGRRGTLNPAELYDEIVLNSEKIFKITGMVTKYYRSGTAYYDDVAVKVCRDAGHVPVNFTIISGDAAGFSAERIERRILNGAKPGAIIIGHMNQPQSKLFQALKKVIPVLKSKGYRFVRLDEYREQLK
jgi:peptidoglycan/xylan/chitin deacetylase (PgdA/CDA1 family)